MSTEIDKLKKEILEHEEAIKTHGFALKSKQAKLRKLEKIMEKFTELINEQLPPAIS